MLLQGKIWVSILCIEIYAFYASLQSFFFEHLCNLNVESGGIEASVTQELASKKQ